MSKPSHTRSSLVGGGIVLAGLLIGYLAGSRGLDRGASGSVYDRTRAALMTPSLLERGRLLAAILADAPDEAPGDLREVGRAFESTHRGMGPDDQSTEMLAEAWAREAPDEGLDRAMGWSPFLQKQFLGPFMEAWARRDSDAARASLERIEDPDRRAIAERAILLGTIDRSPEAGWAALLAEGPGDPELVPEAIARLATREGVGPLLTRLEALPNDGSGASRDALHRSILALGGRLAPEETRRFVEAHLGEADSGLPNAPAIFVASWAAHDPRSALDWAVSRIPDPARITALRVGYQRWADSPATLPDAVEWVEAQTPDVRAAVGDLYALSLASIDSSRALEAARELDGPRRDEITRRIRKLIELREPALPSHADPQAPARPTATATPMRDNG